MSNETSIDSATTARLRAWGAGLPQHVRIAFDALAARLELLSDRQPGYFFHPLGFPVVQLPLWIAAWSAREGRPVPPDLTLRVVESAAVGYLHVRVQDDHLDEGVGESGASMLLAEALLVRHTALLASTTPPSERFWHLFERTWSAYGGAMLLEAALHRPDAAYGAEEFARILERSHALILPSASLLEHLGAWERVAGLETWIARLARAHQVFTDALDAEKDLKNGNHTWVVRRFGGLDGVTALRQNLHLHGGFDTIIDEVSADLDEADRALEDWPLDEAREYIATRRVWMERVRTELQRRISAAARFPSGSPVRQK